MTTGSVQHQSMWNFVFGGFSSSSLLFLPQNSPKHCHLSSYFSRLNFSEVSYVVLSAAEFLKSYRSISEHNTYFILHTSHSVIMKLSFITHNAEQPEPPSVTFCIVCVFSYLCMMSGCGLFHYFHFCVMDIPR